MKEWFRAEVFVLGIFNFLNRKIFYGTKIKKRLFMQLLFIRAFIPPILYEYYAGFNKELSITADADGTAQKNCLNI